MLSFRSDDLAKKEAKKLSKEQKKEVGVYVNLTRINGPLYVDQNGDCSRVDFKLMYLYKNGKEQRTDPPIFVGKCKSKA